MSYGGWGEWVVEKLEGLSRVVIKQCLDISKRWNQHRLAFGVCVPEDILQSQSHSLLFWRHLLDNAS